VSENEHAEITPTTATPIDRDRTRDRISPRYHADSLFECGFVDDDVGYQRGMQRPSCARRLTVMHADTHPTGQ